MLQGKILITGGAGYLGRAIIQRAVDEHWDCQFTIFSTDAVKHARILRDFTNVHSVIGDIRDPMTIYNVMAGKDVVIHAAAVKEIPVSEYHSIDTFQVNVGGSLNIAQAAIQHNTPLVIGISTDKACHPANAYGASKYLMEKMFQEYARLDLPTKFVLTRYGNVIESTASVIEAWKRAFAAGQPIKVTDPQMTRFWLSPNEAVDLIDLSQKLQSGEILIPKLKSLDIVTVAKYIFPENADYDVAHIGLRPGEKIHEELLTEEETEFSVDSEGFYILRPTTAVKPDNIVPYSYNSYGAPRFSREEFLELLENK